MRGNHFTQKLLLALTCLLPVQCLWQQSWKERTWINSSQEADPEKPERNVGGWFSKPTKEQLRRAQEQRRAAAARQQEAVDRMDADFDRWWPALGPAEAPAGRHLQYVVKGRAGMSDRMTTFSILIALGEYHNATVHVLGMSRPAWLLSAAHSPGAISERWDRYFNTSANGDGFWHEIVNFTGCRRVDDPRVDLKTVFDDGSLCVNLVLNMYTYHHWNKWQGVGMRVQPSQDVLDAAQAALERYAVPGLYGTCHVRRCDRLRENGLCTQVDTIRDALALYPNISTWMVFMYVEAAYPTRLRQALRPLRRRVLYEDLITLRNGSSSDGDNYFQYLVAMEIQKRAAVQIETHLCNETPTPYRVFASPQLGLLKDERTTLFEEDAAMGGVCARAASR